MNYLDRYSAALRDLRATNSSSTLPESLLLSREGNLATFYAPFDYVNRNAKICLCGITPGQQQAWLAINKARELLSAGADTETVLRQAKQTASFGGAMRANLVALLDHIGVDRLLGLSSCGELFGAAADRVHYTSALRYPVLVDGKNYSGTPDMLAKPYLREQLQTYLAEEIAALPADCIYIPLGPKVSAALLHLAGRGLLDAGHVLHGLPHPSGANAERISYFLGRKRHEQLSAKTNPRHLDEAKRELTGKLAALRAATT